MPNASIQRILKKDCVRPSAGRFCVLVTSSDSGRDIFEIVFRNSEKIWRDCDWPRFVGFTSKHPDMYGFKALAAKGPFEWRQAVVDYLDALPERIEYILRIDEDALFLSPVDGERLNEIADTMVWENLSYVSLVLKRNIPGRIIEYFRHKLDKRPLRPLSFSEPYYSSLAVAIWKRSYLRSLLQRPGTIWEFEHIVTNERHYAVWPPPLLDQDQLVTRGRWAFRAPRQLARQGLSLGNSKREFQTVKSWLRGLREWITFQLVGFLSFRIRRRFNKVPSLPKDLIESRRAASSKRSP